MDALHSTGQAEGLHGRLSALVDRQHFAVRIIVQSKSHVHRVYVTSHNYVTDTHTQTQPEIYTDAAIYTADSVPRFAWNYCTCRYIGTSVLIFG